MHADFILNHLSVVPFVDVSNVGDDPKRPLAGGVEVAPGLGLRYVTPFGPIRLDVAYLAIAKDQTAIGGPATDPTGARVTMPDTLVSAFCKATVAGCIHVPRLAFHVSLGEAF
jgi:hypothetical protein